MPIVLKFPASCQASYADRSESHVQLSPRPLNIVVVSARKEELYRMYHRIVLNELG